MSTQTTVATSLTNAICHRNHKCARDITTAKERALWIAALESLRTSWAEKASYRNTLKNL